MKNLNVFILLLIFTFITPNIWAVVHPIPSTSISTPTNQSIVDNLDVDAFLSLSPKSLAQKTGQKIKLRDRIVLRLAQAQVHRKIKKGKSVDVAEDYAASNRNFSLGGFLLGFFFSLIGILIAILFGRNAVRSALLGALISLVIWIIFGVSR